MMDAVVTCVKHNGEIGNGVDYSIDSILFN